MSRKSARSLPMLLLSLAAATPALASDGVIELSHVCAVQTGCVSGDTPGYPITLDGAAGSSYRLTSRLVIPDENTDGIIVSASGLTIDLGGFEIVRASCVQATCVATLGSGSGVASLNSNMLEVKNGSITGMGDDGVSITSSSKVSGLRVRYSGGTGINASSGSNIIEGNVSALNGNAGIRTFIATTITGNSVLNNGNEGIYAGEGSTVVHNTSYGNGGVGIYARRGSTVLGNAAHLNTNDGIGAESGCVVSDNSADENDGDGIDVGDGSSVQGNIAQANKGYGLRLTANSAYRGNVVFGNTHGTVLGGLNMGANACNGTPACP